MSRKSARKHPRIWIDGDLVDYENATVHVLSHALHYGSSVFEGIRCYDTPSGPVIFRLTDHIRRLFDSARVYHMPIPFTQEEVEAACRMVVRSNHFVRVPKRDESLQ